MGATPFSKFAACSARLPPAAVAPEAHFEQHPPPHGILYASRSPHASRSAKIGVLNGTVKWGQIPKGAGRTEQAGWEKPAAQAGRSLPPKTALVAVLARLDNYAVEERPVFGGVVRYKK